MEDDRLGGMFGGTRRNAVLGWSLVIALCALALNHAVEGSYRWFVFTGLAVAVVLLPAIKFREPTAIPPWELLVIVLIPVVDATVRGQSALTAVAVYLAVAAVALVVAVEIHRFTSARMNHLFAVVLVVIATLAVSAVWNVAQWVSDVALGTAYIVGVGSQDAANRVMMLDFVYATVAGLLAGLVFDRYFRVRSFSDPSASSPPDAAADRNAGDAGRGRPAREAGGASPVPSLVRDRLDAPDWAVELFSRGMQVALAGLLGYGIVIRDLPTIVNAGVALSITFLPGLLERDYQLPIEPELVFWLTSAVFLHAMGSAGLYGVFESWDTLTHTLSATVVAAAGYTAVRAIDLHTDEIHLPVKLMFAFILLFVLAFGVVWELLEFAIDEGARWAGLDAVLAQHGIDDTITDLVFDLLGAVVVAVWGTVYLADISSRIAEQFGE